MTLILEDVFKVLKNKKALQALDSFHALCANTVKPTSSPQSMGTALLKQPRTHHSSRSSELDQALAFPKKYHTGFIFKASHERSGKYLDPEAPSTPSAAPSSVLFILQ